MFDLDRDVQQRLTREPGPENNVGFFPGDLSIQVGPIYAHDLATEPPVPTVGWIGAGISGSGYFFPWTFREVVARAESTPQVQRMMELCRSVWPVKPSLPGKKIIQLRENYASLWAYDDFDRPWDWMWWPQETG
jgi:hypothetical protein